MKPVAYLHTEPNGNQFIVEADDYDDPCDECQPLYTQAQLDAAVAAERERCACMLDAEHEKRKAWDNHAAVYGRMIREMK